MCHLVEAEFEQCQLVVLKLLHGFEVFFDVVAGPCLAFEVSLEGSVQAPNRLPQLCLAGLLLFEVALVLLALVLDRLQLVQVDGAHVLEVGPQLVARLFQARQVVLKCGQL